jgi:hypothetical protein
MQLDSWTAIELEIDRIIDGNGDGAPFDKDTVDSVRDFVAFAREKCPVPEVGRGYRSAIRFSWSTRPPIESRFMATGLICTASTMGGPKLRKYDTRPARRFLRRW